MENNSNQKRINFTENLVMYIRESNAHYNELLTIISKLEEGKEDISDTSNIYTAINSRLDQLNTKLTELSTVGISDPALGQYTNAINELIRNFNALLVRLNIISKSQANPQNSSSLVILANPAVAATLNQSKISTFNPQKPSNVVYPSIQQSPAQINPKFESLQSVIDSAIKSLEPYATTNKENVNKTLKTQLVSEYNLLESSRDKYIYNKNNTPIDVLCIDFIRLIDDLQQITDKRSNIDITRVYLLKSLLEISVTLLEQFNKKPPIQNSEYHHEISNRLNKCIIDLQMQIKRSFDTNICISSTNDYAELDKSLETSKPVWICIDIDGKIYIYSFTLNKWICAHKDRHKFAYDFMKNSNLPVYNYYIVWRKDILSASVGIQPRQQTPVESKLLKLKSYFQSVDVNREPLTFEPDSKTVQHVKDFRKNVNDFILLLDENNGAEREVKEFLQKLNGGSVYMTNSNDFSFTGNKFLMKHDDKTEFTPPTYNIDRYRQILVKQKEKFNEETNKFTKLQRNINLQKKTKPDAQIPSDKQTEYNTKKSLYNKETTEFRIIELKFDIYRFIKEKLNQITNKNPNPYAKNIIERLADSTMAKNTLKSQLRLGGARKYPAKKYRFASRKHSKRCKTTSHKKACRRKSHKHRRITRKR
jgi:hypothetical protein